jgi:hypothetical protein
MTPADVGLFLANIKTLKGLSVEYAEDAGKH